MGYIRKWSEYPRIVSVLFCLRCPEKKIKTKSNCPDTGTVRKPAEVLYVKPKWEDKATLLFTDTDSLCYEIRRTTLTKTSREMWTNGTTLVIMTKIIRAEYTPRRTKKC